MAGQEDGQGNRRKGGEGIVPLSSSRNLGRTTFSSRTRGAALVPGQLVHLSKHDGIAHGIEERWWHWPVPCSESLQDTEGHQHGSRIFLGC